MIVPIPRGAAAQNCSQSTIEQQVTRRFPPPWTDEELDVCFVVTDSAGQKLAYVYFEDEPGRRSAAKLLTKDEAERVVRATCAECNPSQILMSAFGGKSGHRLDAPQCLLLTQSRHRCLTPGPLPE
jgi:hypothetical protein